MSSAGRPAHSFVAFDALRGAAALVVVERHCHDTFGVPMLPAGYLAVDFFFLLSGWVLAHAYDARLASSMSWLQFMRQRLLRLYPAYLLAVVIAIGVTAATGAVSVRWVFASLLFLPNFWLADFRWMVSPAWSLSAELLANALFAGFHRRLGTRVLISIVIVAFAGLAVTAIANRSLDAGVSSANWYGGPVRVLFSFPLGVLLYRHRATLARWTPPWSTWPAVALMLVLFTLPAAAGLYVVLRDLAIVTMALPALLLFAADSRPQASSARLATLMGDVSYPLYVLHQPLLVLAMAAVPAIWGVSLLATPAWIDAALVILVIVFSAGVTRWVDRPVRAWLARLRWRAARAQPLGVLKSSKPS